MATQTPTTTHEHLVALTRDALRQVKKGDLEAARDFFELTASICAGATATPELLDAPHGLAEAILAAEGDDRRYSSSLALGLRVLALFPDEDALLGVSEVADVLDASRSTMHRYLRTLVRCGQLEQAPAGRKYRRPRGQA